MRNANPKQRFPLRRTIMFPVLLIATVFFVSAYVLYPWYYFMDMGMLSGIKKRSEGVKSF